MEDITKVKHLKFKEILAYSLGLFGFQAIVGLLNSYQAEFDGSILGVDIGVVGILILVAKILSAVADPIVGGMVAGLGGLYFVMDYTAGAWTNNGFGDRGWLAIAIVIFALWKPKSAILSSFLFGGLYIICVYIPGLSSSAKEIIKMLPYVVTIIVLIIISARKKKEHQPPQSLGLTYFREER